MLIDPTKYAPALNMFAKSKRHYEGPIAEQIENNLISLFQYIFSSRNSALTEKQLTCFSFCVRLLFAMPDATIGTLLTLLRDPVAGKTGGIRPDSPFKPYIDSLDLVSKDFFYNNFYDTTDYASTKDQIATPIFGMLRYSTFQQMFLTKENKIDMFELLQSKPGKIILVSSPQAMLGADGSQLFCRYIVALAPQGAYERINIPESQWRPAYILMDEAQEMVDEVKTGALLTQMRHFKLGALLAHQNIKPQLTDGMFSTLSANTRIKCASTRSYADAAAMAKDMRCTPEFIMNQQKTGTTVRFALFCDGVTPHPFSFEVDFIETNNFDKVSGEEYKRRIDLMKKRYGAPPIKPDLPITHKPPEIHGPREVSKTSSPVQGKPEPA